MKFEKFKRSYQLEFFTLALLGLVILGFFLCTFIENPDIPVNIGAIVGSAILFILGIVGFLKKWRKTDAIKTDGIAYILYNKRNKLVFSLYSAIDGIIAFIMVVGVLYWGNFVDFTNIDLMTKIVLVFAFFFFLASSIVNNYRKYKAFEDHKKHE